MTLLLPDLVRRIIGVLYHIHEEGGPSLADEDYIEAMEYGMPPLGGFAFGAERITMHILGLKNIREASLFPRDMERVDIRLSTLRKGTKGSETKEKDIYEKIIDLLKSNEILFEKYEHEPVYTAGASLAKNLAGIQRCFKKEIWEKKCSENTHS